MITSKRDLAYSLFLLCATTFVLPSLGSGWLSNFGSITLPNNATLEDVLSTVAIFGFVITGVAASAATVAFNRESRDWKLILLAGLWLLCILVVLPLILAPPVGLELRKNPGKDDPNYSVYIFFTVTPFFAFECAAVWLPNHWFIARRKRSK